MSFEISQNLFSDNATTVITVVKCDDDAVSKKHLQLLLDTTTNSALGISATYGKNCQLSSIAFSTLSRVLVVNVPACHVPRPKHPEKQRHVDRSRSLIQDRLLLNSALRKYAFTMDQLAVALYLDLSIRINGAVDMLSVSTSKRQSLDALVDAMGGEAILQKENVRSLFFATSESQTIDATAQVVLKAWAACRAATFSEMSIRFASLPRVDTMSFPKTHLAAIATISRHADLLDALKSTASKNEVTNQFQLKNDAIDLVCARFSTRIKKSRNQVIRIELERKGATSQITGQARKVNGRRAYIKIGGPVSGDKIISVTTIGKDDLTCAESARQTTILDTLQHKTSILSNPFFRVIWLPKERPVWPKSRGQNGTVPVYFSRPLNPSQHVAVKTILSEADVNRIVLVQGPPGTGKTTVIAASIISHDHANSDQNIWVAAQSNVAVKNIAEKLVKEGFYRFKLVVSKDFHFDWHEHLYKKVEPCLIRADRLIDVSTVEAERHLCGCRVILCTLSMLSTPMVDAFLLINPMEMLVLDEASQIECGNYLAIFNQFHHTLSKLVLVGDDKQLPPHGQERIPHLRSIFEFPHLRRRALFLDTQYRMPHVIGDFISRNVYGGKLLTQHSWTTPKACRFVDVSNGRESKMGHSWINRAEAHTVVKLARLCGSKNMSFRIITPYDAQRSCIESLLKSEKLNWEDKVFNVDSFQGNEDDHIIISVVRSHSPGFLANERRANVMLTRCKASMVICSSRDFIFGKASGTLMGKLAASLDNGSWINAHDVLNGRVGDLFARDMHS